MKKYIPAFVCLSLAIGSHSLLASDLNILWYVPTGSPGGTSLSNYETQINHLVSQEESAAFNISGSINNWNVTFWTGGALPVGNFNVLVGGSSDNFGPAGYSSFISSINQNSFGSRVMLTGQDADYHYINSPGSGSFNNPAGFLIDAINWAGSGQGMGGVLLGLDAATVIPFAGETAAAGNDNTVIIPGSEAGFPINAGLTSAGLSNWGTSAHDSFAVTDSSLWTVINVGGGGEAVTIVSAHEAAGATTAVPDTASTVGLLALAAAALFTLQSLLPQQRSSNV